MYDESAYLWALSNINKLPAVTKRRLEQSEKYVDRIGTHTSLYYSESGKKAFMCVYEELGQKLYWSEIVNYDQIFQEDSRLVELLLRNGEYLYTQLTGGKDQKIINLSFIKKN